MSAKFQTTTLLQFLDACDGNLKHRLLIDLAKQHDILRWFVSEPIERELAKEFPTFKWNKPMPLPTGLGLCAVPVVWCREQMHSSGRAAILPLRWVCNQAKSVGIPRNLSEFADSVVGALRQCEIDEPGVAECIGDNRWSLEWAPSTWSGVDLRDLNVTPESSFAPLAIGLVAAASGVHSDAQFIASGSFDDGSWRLNAEGALSKFGFALRLGFRRFAYPRSMSNIVDHLLAEHLPSEGADESRADLHAVQRFTLPNVDAQTNLYRSMHRCLPIAGLEPGVKHSIDQRLQWHATLSRKPAQEYFVRCLLADVVEKSRMDLNWKQLENASQRKLIAVFSQSVDLLWQSWMLIQPQELNILCTQDLRQECDRFVAELQQYIQSHPENTEAWACKVQVIEVESSIKCLSQISLALQHRKDVPDAAESPRDWNGTVIDLTSGRRSMQLAELQGAQPGDRLLCWWSDTVNDTRRPDLTRCIPLMWQIDADGKLRRVE